MNADPQTQEQDLYDNYDADPREAGDTKPKESDEPTALIPKSLVPGDEPAIGEEVVFVIKAIHESELEIGYAPKKPEKESAPVGDPNYD